MGKPLRQYAKDVGYEVFFRSIEERARLFEERAKEARRPSDRLAYELLAERCWRAAARLILDVALSAKLRTR